MRKIAKLVASAVSAVLFAVTVWGQTETVLTFDCATPAPTGSTSTAFSSSSDIATFLNSAAGLSSASNKITCSAKTGDVYKGKGSGGGDIPQQCLKVGKASGGGGFTFTIPDNYATIDEVEMTCYGWKTTSSISVNSGTAQTFTTAQSQTTKTFALSTSSRTISIAVTTSAVCITEIVLKSSGSSSTLTTSDLAITGDPVALSFDLYNDSSAKTVSYTTSSTGTVTVSGGTGYVSTTVNSGSKVIYVTPTAVTPSAQTITINQAADDTYAAGSATFTVSISDSSPYVQPTEIEITPNYSFWGQTAQFSGSTYNSLSGSKDNVSLEWSRGDGSTYANTTAMRFYKDNTLTFNAPSGYEIKSIELDVTGTYTDLGFDPSGFDSDNKIWTGSSETVEMSRPLNASSYATISKFTITIGLPSTDPSITANNVNIEYAATNGSIAYTLSNPVSGGVLTAATPATWLTPGTDTGSAIPFTCEANSETTSRSATVTLTYTYNTNETVTKDVTVTQAAAPLIYTTIPALFEAATSTSTNVNITFGSWVVSAVKNSNAYLTDNQGHGLIIYESDHGFAVNDVLTGTVSCELQLYRGSAELTGIKASTDGLTVTKNGSITAQTIAINSLGGVNTGALLSFEGLTYNGSALVDGDSQTITPYTTLYDYGSTFENGKSYDVTGIYLQYNSTKELLPRSADDIEETVIPSIVLTPASNNHTAAAVNDGSISIAYSNISINSASDFTIKYYDSNETELSAEPDWIAASVESVSGDYVVTYLLDANTGAARSAYLKVLAGGVYSNLVTINQAEPVVDYAFLPFTFNAGKNALVQGLTASGLGSDYNSNTAPNTQLKFDSTGDWLKLKLNEVIPGTHTLAFDIKGNSFSDGTFKVQTSADDDTYTDLIVFSSTMEDGTYQFDNIPETVRYIKWVYITKVNGNVGLGNIKLTRPAQPATMTVTAAYNNGRYWATFYNSAACYNLPAGAKAYTMNGDHKLYLLGEGGVIPANTAVIIIAEAASDAATLELTLTKTDDETVDISGTTNILKGSNYPVPVSGTPYVLGNKSGIQFYKYTGDNIPANKAYYK